MSIEKAKDSSRIARELFVRLHKTKNVGLVLWEAKSKLSVKQVFDFSSSITKHPLTSRLLDQVLYPRRVQDFHLPIGRSNTLLADVACMLGSVDAQSGRVSKFIQLKIAFERAHLLSNRVQVTRLLEEVQDLFGQSLWLFEARISAAQVLEGFEVRREVTNGIHSSANAYVDWLVGQFSSRYEPEVKPRVFASSIIEAFSNSDSKDHLSSSVYFRLIPFILWPGMYDEHLAPFSTLPLIDQVSYLPFLVRVSGFDPSRLSLSEETRAALRQIGICFSASPTSGSPDDGFGKLIENYTAGRYADCLLHVKESPFQFASVMIVAASALARIGGDITSLESIRGSLLEKLVVSLSSILSLSQNPLQPANEILKHCVNLPMSLWAGPLAQFTSQCYGKNILELDIVDSNRIPHFDSPHNPLNSMNQPGINSPITSTYLNWQSEIKRSAVTQGIQPLVNIEAQTVKFHKAVETCDALGRSETHAILADLMANSDPIYRVRAPREAIRLHIEDGQMNEACRLLCREVIRNEHLIWALQVFRGAFFDHSKQKADTESSFYNLASIHFFNKLEESKEYHSILIPILEQIIGFGENSLTTRITNLEVDNKLKIMILWEITTIQMLAETCCFHSLEEIEKERLEICQWLVQNDSENEASYRPEIQEITKLRLMRTHRRSVEHSKIYVDEQSLKKQLAKLLKDRFGLISVLAEHSAFKTTESVKVFLANTQGKSGKITFITQNQILDSEIDKFAIECFEQYSSSPQYGLDAYLSSRLRHGTMMGHLRQPFEVQHLITSLNPESGRYTSNDWWIDRIDRGFEFVDAINDAFSDLSQSVDSCISDFKEEVVQVCQDANSQAVFAFVYGDDQRRKVRAAARISNSVEELINEIFSILGSMLRDSLARVRREIDEKLGQPLGSALTTFERTMYGVCKGSYISELSNSIARTRTEIQKAISQLTDWFAAEIDLDKQPFSIGLAIELVEDQLKNIYPNQPFKLEKSVQSESSFLGKYLPFFTDIVLILLDNAVRYGQRRNGECIIDLSCTTDIKNNLTLVMVNELSGHVDKKDFDRKIDAIRDQLSNHLVASRSEGASGLLKVEKILEWDLGVEHDYDFRRKGRAFEVFIRLSTAGLCESS